jgi:hypothetical protein
MFELHVIRTDGDPLLHLVMDDPVRPEIPVESRIGDFAEILVAADEQDEPIAVVCIRYCDQIPTSVEEMMADPGSNTVAVFYTIWSYRPGAGGKLIFMARNHIESTRPGVSRFVTLSPRTAVARRFHLRNGAGILQENPSTVNYEYV